MRISSTKSRFLALLSSASLVATVVIAAPANAAAVGPICDKKVPVQTCQGMTSDGADESSARKRDLVDEILIIVEVPSLALLDASMLI